MALRKMANTPVESMKVGGFWWLQDLTVHDPYYIMPLVTSVTMYITIELGVDGTNLKTIGIMRYVLRAIPFAVLPFMIHFPGVSFLFFFVNSDLFSRQTLVRHETVDNIRIFAIYILRILANALLHINL